MNSLTEQILPFIAAQLYLFCLLYLVVVRRRYPQTFLPLVLFLGAMIFFLGCYLLNQVEHSIHGAKLIHLRLLVLMGVGFPSLALAGSKFSDHRSGWRYAAVLYGAGGLLALACIFFNSIAWRESFGDGRLYFSEALPGFAHGWLCSVLCAVLATVATVIIPCIYHLCAVGRRNLTHQAFLISALAFALLFVVGILTQQWWIYYAGSIACALIFLGAVYIDIHYLNQSSAFLKEELRFHVTQGERSSQTLVKLIEKLEESSSQNLEVYKLRVREVISLLVNEAIDSGGDVNHLIQRNKEAADKIENAEGIDSLTQVTAQEARELSEMITNLPLERKKKVVSEAKAFITANLGEELSIQTLTDSLHVSRSYLTSAFREVEHCTVNASIVSARITRAKELLRHQSITETAFEVGFNNSNYFSTVFKKQTGLTPNAYQKQVEDTGF